MLPLQPNNYSEPLSPRTSNCAITSVISMPSDLLPTIWSINTCQEINFDELTRLFGLGSAVTTKRYVGYLVQAFLVIQIHKFSFKSRIRLRESKGYVVDTGMIANRADALVTENQGWRLENVVYIELLRRCAPLFHDVCNPPLERNPDFTGCSANMIF